MRIEYKEVGDGYEVTKRYKYYSKRYNRYLTVPKGFFSDGATGANDIESNGWIIHDWVCRYGVWDDGTRIDNWTASTVLADILWKEGYHFRALSWWFATYLFGGGAARDNGMRRVKEL